MSEVMIEARGLTKRYGPFRALDNATFNVSRGEILGFLGPNGAGKSTTMKILTCFIAPTEGTATVNGCDIWADPLGARAAIGYLPESTPLYTEMLVAEYLEFMGEMRGLRGDKLAARVQKVVDETDLGSVYGKEIRQLSKGFKQRVGLAQALIHEPPVLILDEPMSGLDPNPAIEIRDLIRDIGKERTVILSTHNLAEVQVTCQRVLIISGGKIVADDTPAALTSRGTNRFTVAVLRGQGAGNKAQGLREPAFASPREAFAAIPGVDVVRETAIKGDEIHFEILPAAGDTDLRAAIFKAAVDAGLVLLEMRAHKQNLEQIFRELTTTDLPANAAAADGEDDDDDDDDDEDEE
jgi:ABC-2 type transport system ATP-binding protein